MTKEEIEERLGCPLEKLPMESLSPRIAVDCDGYKGTFSVLRVVVEMGIRPYIEFWVFLDHGRWRIKKGCCYTGDYGLTWAASEDDWEFAKKWREELARGYEAGIRKTNEQLIEERNARRKAND